MWPFRKLSRREIVIGGARRALQEEVTVETLTEAYGILEIELESRLQSCYLNPEEQENNNRDIYNFAVEMMLMVDSNYRLAPDFFDSEKNVERVYGLMKRAEHYTEGSKFEVPMVGKADDFLESVKVTKAEHEAWCGDPIIKVA